MKNVRKGVGREIGELPMFFRIGRRSDRESHTRRFLLTHEPYFGSTTQRSRAKLPLVERS